MVLELAIFTCIWARKVGFSLLIATVHILYVLQRKSLQFFKEISLNPWSATRTIHRSESDAYWVFPYDVYRVFPYDVYQVFLYVYWVFL